MRFNALLATLCILLTALTSRPVRSGEERAIDPPDDREFVLDFADIVTKEDTAKICTTGKKLWTDVGVRLVVITVKSMSHYNDAPDMLTFTRKILDHWIEKQTAKPWTKAVLIVRAKEDKKVRIQLGGAWKHALDDDVEDVMKKVLVPRFKANKVSEGLLETANAMDKLLRKNIDKANVEAADPGTTAPPPPAEKK